MCRLTRLLFALVICTGGLTAGLIDFTGEVIPSPPGSGDGLALASASDDGTTVTFFTDLSSTDCSMGCAPAGSAYGAVEGGARTAFANNVDGDDTTTGGGGNGEFLTNEPSGNSTASDYFFSISGLPIFDFGLLLYDFGDSLFSGPGGTATLQAYSDASWSTALGAPATYTVPAMGFVDGNIQSLMVTSGGMTPISTLRLSFSSGMATPGQDTGTGVDDLTWTTATTAIPEPGTIALFGTGLLALAGIARRRRIRG